MIFILLSWLQLKVDGYWRAGGDRKVFKGWLLSRHLYSEMAVRVILAVLLLLFSIAKVSCDPKNDEEMSHVSQEVHVFTRGVERRPMHDIVVRISKYFNRGRLQALAPAPSPPPSHINCNGLCNHRCSLHSRPNVCLRACGTCCVRCNCVPPGTFGNRELCGKCYTDECP